jgi:hypothetical protein
MSNHTKAWALAREVPDDELRTELILANERILDAAQDLEAEEDLEGAVYQATEWRDTLRSVADKLDCDTDEIEDWVTNQLEKLQAEAEKPKESDVEKSKQLADAFVRIEAMEVERALLKVEVRQLEAAALLPDDLRTSVGDVLAMSRKLATFCEAAGIKPATLRVTRTRRKAS